MDLNLWGEPGRQTGHGRLASHKRGESVPSSPERVCKRCGETFTHVKGINGTKYCDACQKSAYKESVDKWTRAKSTEICIGCGVSDTAGDMNHLRFKRGYVCQTCWVILGPVYGSFARHHVHTDRIAAFIASPCCAACGVSLVTRQRNSRGEWTYPLVIDHDHDCCQGPLSCGECVRAMLCNRCNIVVGYLREDVTIALGVVDFLRTITKP